MRAIAGVLCATALFLPGCATESVSDQALLSGLSWLRLSIAVAALGLLLAAARLGAGQRRKALLLLALLAFFANFHFFVRPHQGGFHAHDLFHYYMGSKYFPELGYYDLYPCTVGALREATGARGLREFPVRDLRRNQHVPASQLMPRGPYCDGRFSEARWSEFRNDVYFMKSQFISTRWFIRALADYGYNPSPVWTLVGRPIASAVPASHFSLNVLARLDLVLLAGTFLLLGWAFGLEVACLATIAWAANPLCGYVWIGDSFLRYLWFAASFSGIAMLRRGWGGPAGALLSAAACLRLFPVLLSAGVGLRALARAAQQRRIEASMLRFGAAFLASALLLIGASIWASGRGTDAYRDFGENISAYNGIHFWNAVGLRSLVTYSPIAPEAEPRAGGADRAEAAQQQLRAGLFDERRWLYLGLAALAVALFVRASLLATAWEAAALGCSLVPILTGPPPYYLACMVGTALLSARRPRIGVAVLLAVTLWNVGGIALPLSLAGYQLASVIAVALCAFTLMEMQRPLQSE